MRRRIEMKIYKDKTLKEEVEILDLGIVEAGTTRKYTYYVYNELLAELKDLVFEVEHKDVKLLKSPTTLNPCGIDELILEWTPAVTLKQGLKTTLKIAGKELWKP